MRIARLIEPLILVPLFLSAFALPSQANDWPGWLGPNRNSISHETGWLKEWPKQGLKQLWQAKVGLGFSTVSVKDGRLFTMGHGDGSDTVYCLNSESGEEIWKHSYPCSLHEDSRGVPGTGATPTADGDCVYTLSRDGHLFCLDAASGDVRWFRNPHKELETKMSMFGFTGSPLVTDRFAIVDVGAAVALDKKTGEIAWSTGDFGGTYASPQSFKYEGQELVTVFNSTGLIVLKANSGEEFCRKPWPTPQFDTNSATPVVSGNKIFISSGYDRGCALLEISGATEPAILWEDEKARTYYNTWVLWEGHFYGFVEEELVCIEFETGKRRWAEKSVGKGCAIVVDGMLVILSEKGELVLAEADPQKYGEVSRSHNIGGRCWSLPVLADGRLYLRNSKGLLVCLDVRAGEKKEAGK
jgi:outer membrane protein assembly factor BamB